MRQQGRGLEEDVWRWRNVSVAEMLRWISPETIKTMMEAVVLLSPTVREAPTTANPYGGVVTNLSLGAD
jgi:predicted phosphatase